MRFDLNNFSDEETDNWLFGIAVFIVIIAVVTVKLSNHAL